TGSTGAAGADGIDANGVWKYTFDDSTSSGDPGSNRVRFNTADVSSVTTIYLDVLDQGFEDISSIIMSYLSGTSAVKGYIRFQRETDPYDTWNFFEITAVSDL